METQTYSDKIYFENEKWVIKKLTISTHYSKKELFATLRKWDGKLVNAGNSKSLKQALFDIQ